MPKGYGYFDRPERDPLRPPGDVTKPPRLSERRSARQQKEGVVYEIYDHQNPKVLRVKIGQLGDTDTDWGIEVYDASGNPILQAGGLGSGTVGTAELAANAVTADKISVSQLSALTADMGTLTAGTVKDVNDRFVLDLAALLLTVTDEQGTPVDRVKIGKVGPGVSDYGIEVYDASGSLILSATGLGIDVVDSAQIVSAAVGSTELADGSVGLAKHAASLEPVDIVDSLPSPSGYSGAKTLFLTTDKKLYRYDSSVPEWTAAVPTDDLTGQIVETQISDDSISTPKLQANAVTAAEIAAGTITATEIAANTLTAGEIAAGAISTDELAANAVTADKISVSQLSAIAADVGELVAGTMQDTSGAGWQFQIDLDVPVIEVKDGGGTTRVKLGDVTGGGVFGIRVWDASGTLLLDETGGGNYQNTAHFTSKGILPQNDGTGSVDVQVDWALSDAASDSGEVKVDVWRIDDSDGDREVYIGSATETSPVTNTSLTINDAGGDAGNDKYRAEIEYEGSTVSVSVSTRVTMSTI